MKKIITNKLYDTDTAKKICHASDRDDANPDNYWTETLYRKRTGEFFLHCSGGAASRYARKLGQGKWESGEEIIPLSLENARNWANAHLLEKEFDEIFSSPKDVGKVSLFIQVPSDLAAWVRMKSSEQNIGIGAFVTAVLENERAKI